MSDLRPFRHLPSVFEAFRNEFLPFRDMILYPPVDISENATHLLIKAEVPGVNPENLDIFVGENSIVLKATTDESKEVNEQGYRRFERRSGSFERSIAYPIPVLSNQAKATLKNGLLEIRIPKDQSKYQNMKKLSIDTEN